MESSAPYTWQRRFQPAGNGMGDFQMETGDRRGPRAELEKTSEDVRGKEEAEHNEKLKSNELKTSSLQTDGRSRNRFGI